MYKAIDYQHHPNACCVIESTALSSAFALSCLACPACWTAPSSSVSMSPATLSHTDMLESQLRLSDSHPDIGTDIKPQFRLPGFDADFQHGPSHTTASSDAPILRVVRPLPGSERQPSSVHGGVRISPHDQEPFCDLPPGSSPASADCQALQPGMSQHSSVHTTPFADSLPCRSHRSWRHVRGSTTPT